MLILDFINVRMILRPLPARPRLRLLSLLLLLPSDLTTTATTATCIARRERARRRRHSSALHPSTHTSALTAPQENSREQTYLPVPGPLPGTERLLQAIHQARQLLRRAPALRKRAETPRGDSGAEGADGADEVRRDRRLVRVGGCFGFLFFLVGGHGGL